MAFYLLVHLTMCYTPSTGDGWLEKMVPAFCRYTVGEIWVIVSRLLLALQFTTDVADGSHISKEVDILPQSGSHAVNYKKKPYPIIRYQFGTFSASFAPIVRRNACAVFFVPKADHIGTPIASSAPDYLFIGHLVPLTDFFLSVRQLSTQTRASVLHGWCQQQ